MRAARLVPIASLVLMACAGASTAPPRAPLHVAPAAPEAFRDPGRRTKIAAAATKLDALFAEDVKKEKLPGLAVGLVVDGDLVWSKGYGARDATTNAPIDADTVFRVGSITKTFTAVAALQLRDAGRLALDEPASRWIPELDAVTYPTADSPPITLRALLTHTSGLPRLGAFSYTDPARAPSEAEVTASLRDLALAYTPGTREEYSNLGFGLAGIAVGRAAGMPYRDYVTAYLLRPLGMTSTAWDREAAPPERLATGYARGEGGALEKKEHWRLGASEGAGGIYSSVHDMARWAAMHLQAYPPRNEGEAWPVKRATLREAMTIHHADGVREPSIDPASPSTSGVAYGWHSFDDCDLERVAWHNGGTEGYSSMIAMVPERGVALIALTNVADADVDRVVIDALRSLAKSGAIPPRASSASPALLEARERVLRLMDQWNEADAQQLMTKGFLDGVGGMAKVHEVRDALSSAMGACAHDGDVDAEGQLHAHWISKCARGSMECDAFLVSTSPVRLAGLGCRASKAPSDALSKAATRIAALSDRWDDATYEELLYPTFAKDEMKKFFAGIARDAGSCKVDRPFDGDGASRAKWHLACAKHAIDLEVTLDPKNGRVGEMLVVPNNERDDGRCGK